MAYYCVAVCCQEPSALLLGLLLIPLGKALHPFRLLLFLQNSYCFHQFNQYLRKQVSYYFGGPNVKHG